MFFFQQSFLYGSKNQHNHALMPSTQLWQQQHNTWGHTNQEMQDQHKWQLATADVASICCQYGHMVLFTRYNKAFYTGTEPTIFKLPRKYIKHYSKKPSTTNFQTRQKLSGVKQWYWNLQVNCCHLVEKVCIESYRGFLQKWSLLQSKFWLFIQKLFKSSVNEPIRRKLA